MRGIIDSSFAMSRDKTAGRARFPILGGQDNVVCTLFKAVLGDDVVLTGASSLSRQFRGNLRVIISAGEAILEHVAEPLTVVVLHLKEGPEVAAQDDLLTRVSRVDRDQGRGSE